MLRVDSGLASSALRGLFRAACAILLLAAVAALAPAAPAPKPAELHVAGVECRREGRQGLTIQFGLSEAVDVGEFKSHLVLRPAVQNLRIDYDLEHEQAFQLFGDWIPEKEYKYTIQAGLKTLAGTVLAKGLDGTFKTEKAVKSLDFNQDNKYYFPRKGGPELRLETRHVGAVTLHVSRMFPNNITNIVGNVSEGYGSQRFEQNWCEELKKQEIKISGSDYALIKTPIDLRKYLPASARGVYYLRAEEKKTGEEAGEPAEGDDDYDYEMYSRRSDGKLIVQTNLGLLAHWQEKGLVLFAHDLTTVKPVFFARVTVWSSKNQLMAEGHTGMDGTAVFKDLNPALGKPKVAVVEKGDDYTFLDLTPRPEDNAQQKDGLDPFNRDGYDAFIYADRELYRPGEMAHLRWIVRKNYGDAAAGVPLMISIIKPNGKSLLTKPTVLSKLGTGVLDLQTQTSYPTGSYTVQLLVPGEERKIIGSYTFYVEEFVPSRMKATIATKDERWLARRDNEITVHGEHLFGGGASDRRAEATLILRQGEFAPERWKGFKFGNETEFEEARLSAGQRQTDKDGNAVFKFNWQPKADVTYPLRATITGSVYELGGRPVTAKKELTLFPSETCLGLDVERADKPRSVVARAAAVNKDEGPAALGEVKLTLEKQVWYYSMRRFTGYNEPSWSQSFREVETKTVALKGGIGAANFTVSGYGYYRVRVHSDATPQYSTQMFYCWGEECDVIDASRPSLITVTPNKASYQVGETAELRIDSPFNGRVFGVLQGDKFEETFETEITSNTAKIKFKVRPEYFPCLWAQVTAMHSIARQPMAISPYSSFAQAPIRVIDPRRELKLSFPGLQTEVRPGGEVAFTVEVRDSKGRPASSAEITLAAVDEGIHLTTGYKNPDPWGWLTRLRRPTLNRAHYYDKIAYDTEKAAPGGDESAMGKRLGTPGENWIKPLALWSGPVTLDKQGRAVIKFRLPEFSGQLRLVAVGCTAEALGAQSGSIFVRRPYMLQTSQPRFLLPGDLFRAQAVLYNRSGAQCKARLSWNAGGAMEPVKGQAEIDVPVGGEATQVVDFKAARIIGQGYMRWDVAFFDPAGKQLDAFGQDVPLPVHAPAAFQSRNEFMLLKPGETRELRNSFFVESPNTELELTAGADMQMRLQESLQWVVKYPYGCVEQTTSRLFPLYMLRQSTAVTSAALAGTDQSLDDIIRAGVDRLFSMQTADGGLAFWPGGRESYAYGSVYALHCLTVMKMDRQVEIPRENFAALQRYVRKLATMEVQNPWYFNNLFQRAYAVSVLALGGDLDAVRMIESFDQIVMPRPARYLLAAALAQNTRDPERVKKYLATAPMKEWSDREQDGCLSSPIRNTAIEMLALEKIGADPAELETRARILVDWLTKNHYGSTQQTAFVVTALAGYLGGRAGNVSQAAVTITDAEGAAHTIKGAEVYRGTAKGAGKSFRIVNTGGADVAVNFTTRGLPVKPDEGAIAQSIRIERRYMAGDLKTTGTIKLHQTESPIVRLDIINTSPASLKNVIVSDLLPAGLEIENPRLNPDAMPGTVMKDAVTPEHLELRDDRLVLAFGEIQPGTHHFYYLVRAVTPGRYQYPAVEAECMYDAALKGRSATGWVEVQK